MLVHMFVQMHMHMNAVAHGGQKKVSDLPRAGVIGSCELGTKLGSSTRAE